MEKPESETKARNLGYTATKVKMEKASADYDNESNEDDDGENDAGDDEDGDDQGDEKRQAARIYKRSLKVLKFKLYFEDFFPTDDDRSAFIYDCWATGAKTTKGINGDRANFKTMLYDFKYDKKVRKSARPNSPPPADLDVVREEG